MASLPIVRFVGTPPGDPGSRRWGETRTDVENKGYDILAGPPV